MRLDHNQKIKLQKSTKLRYNFTHYTPGGDTAISMITGSWMDFTLISDEAEKSIRVSLFDYFIL